MNEEEQNPPTLDVNDLDNMLRAVKHAHSRGSYTMEEVAQLFPVVQRVEAWLEAYKSQLEASTTMPMPVAEEAEEEPASTIAEIDAQKTKKAKTKKQKK